jgi:hydroxymethylbilane synthase
MPSPADTIRLGTRGSLLARTQSRIVADELEKAHPGVQVELIIVKTTGDAITDKPLHDIGGKGLFVKELELALLAGEVDFAVHSYKDVPVTMPLVDESNLIIAATSVREDPRDVLVTRGDGRTLADLPTGGSVATGSLRRRCQVLNRRADLKVVPIRGNVDTRLRKLQEGNCDAVILALAGVKRVGLFDSAIMSAIEVDEMLPAPGQGALALQCRKDDSRMRDLLTVLNDADCTKCVEVEREIVRRLGGDCHSPIAAFAVIEQSDINLRVAVGARDGELPVAFAQSRGSAQHVVEECVDNLHSQDADVRLHPE